MTEENEQPTIDGSPDREQPAQETDWEAKYREAVANSRKWEGRAKENSAAAKELEEIKQAQMSETEKAALQAKKATERAEKAEEELQQLKADAERRAIAQEISESTGVPVSLITASTREEMEVQAKAIKAYAEGQPTAHVFKSDGKRPGKAPKTPEEAFKQFIENQM